MEGPATDIAILGGGLAGGLIALAFADRRPDLRVCIIERGDCFGGDHVWSFFASDLGPDETRLVEPLIEARWDGYDVRFPTHERHLSTPYRSVTSARLDSALRSVLPEDALLTGREVTDAAPESVRLADGETIRARAVIDARGASRFPHMAGGWQKFVGQKLSLASPHGVTCPIVMDASVEQVDGYRFVYCLPFSDTELFVEDTYYSDHHRLDRPAIRSRISAYVRDKGWKPERILYEEAGVLPVVAKGDLDAFRNATGRPETARAGVRAGLFHPLTSYSLPDAVRFAIHLTTLDNLTGVALGKASHDWARNHWRRGRFHRMLTRMLFGASQPDQRYRILERFYKLPEPLIERFYAGRGTGADAARILLGKPPVPLGAAALSLAGRGRPLATLGDQV